MTNKDKELLKIQKSLIFLAESAEKDETITSLDKYYDLLVSYLMELWYNKKLPEKLNPKANVYIFQEEETGVYLISFTEELENYITKGKTLYPKGKENLKWIF